MVQFLNRLRTPNLPTPPGTPAQGEVYTDSDDGVLYWFNGTSWVAAGGGGGGGGVNVSEEGVAVVSPATTLNFVGPGITATDGGSGVAVVTVVQSPTGTIVMWPTTSIPPGWMMCDGSAISRGSYANLFAVLGTSYGTGDGSTTFNIPDLRMRYPVGQGAGSGFAIGTNEGVTDNTQRQVRFDHRHTHAVSGTTAGEPQDHTHGVLIGVATNTATTGGAATRVTQINGSSTSGARPPSDGRSNVHTHTFSDTSDSQGVGGQNAGIAYHPYLALNFIIKL